VHPHQKMDDKQLYQKEMLAEKKGTYWA